MAMTKTLWSINALATEFDLDRRVVAKRIDHIRPASRDGEPKRWHLIDVVSVLSSQPRAPGVRQDTYGFSNVIGKRLDKTLDVRDVAVTLPVFDELVAYGPKVLVNQLRAGMPYMVEGNRKTGEGFMVQARHCIDWGLLLRVLLRTDGRFDLERQLGFLD